MAGIDDYSTNPADNTNINGVDIGEDCAAGNLNDALRQLMADIRAFANTYASLDLPLAISQGGTGAGSASAALTALGGLGIAYRQLPQSAKSAAFQFDLTQGAGHVYYTGAAAAATIPANATVAFPTGTAIAVINNGSGSLTLTRAGSVVLKWANTGADADRVLAAGGMATLIKVDTNTWFVIGAQLS